MSSSSLAAWLTPVVAGIGVSIAALAIAAEPKYPGIGRAATPAEIAAWDIDVRPDLKGLPPGSGSVAKGQVVWEAKCASCHGTFGESNEVFVPIIGGTTAEDIKTGRVKSLVTGDVSRTTMMKLSQISTLWDYVNRAMPWNAPKTLGTGEVYASVAYMLHLADIVPADFVLSDRNMAEVQARLPNRNGKTLEHGLGSVSGKPDVRNVACMKDCLPQVSLSSALPEHASGAHGNLAEQNRPVGPVRGLETIASGSSPAPASRQSSAAGTAAALATSKACMSCHGVDKKIVGPAFTEIAAKYKADSASEARLVGKVIEGGSGAWGAIPMPPNPGLAPADAKLLVQWILSGAK